ncbi:MAG: hypothetical protein JRF43_05970 [Deltaproteobacteria bacterium]|nr:hypothetical protein [Deltaproteobacteria bacterium]
MAPAEHLTEQRYAPHERQASPEQGKLSLYNCGIYHISLNPGLRTCFAASPGNLALYAISVPRIKSGAGLAHSFLHYGFLQTRPHCIALAFG